MTGLASRWRSKRRIPPALAAEAYLRLLTWLMDRSVEGLVGPFEIVVECGGGRDGGGEVTVRDGVAVRTARYWFLGEEDTAGHPLSCAGVCECLDRDYGRVRRWAQWVIGERERLRRRVERYLRGRRGFAEALLRRLAERAGYGTGKRAGLEMLRRSGVALYLRRETRDWLSAQEHVGERVAGIEDVVKWCPDVQRALLACETLNLTGVHDHGEAKRHGNPGAVWSGAVSDGVAGGGERIHARTR